MIFELHQWQKDGVKFLLKDEPRLLNMPHRYLAHEPGCGKTITTVEALKELGAKSALIVCPPKVREDVWQKTLINQGFAREDQIGIISSQMADSQWYRPFLVIGWQMSCLPIPRAFLLDRKFEVGILDEARALKSTTSQTTLKFLGRNKPLLFTCRRKWLLDGTPVPNRPIEIFPVSKVLASPLLGRFKDYNAFGLHFCDGYKDDTYGGATNVAQLGELLAPFIQQVRISDVYDMPKTVFRDVFIDIGQAEDIDEDNTPLETLRRAIGLAKLPYVIPLLKDQIEKLARNNKRLLIYTHHRDVNRILVDQLNGIQLIGGMPKALRDKALMAFKHPDNRRPLIANIRAAGDALDGLQYVCSDVAHVQMDWSAGVNNQGMGRVRRYGQDQEMEVTRYIAVNTIDEPVLGTHTKKNTTIREFYAKEKPKMFEQFIDLFTRLVVAVERLSGDEPEAVQGKKATGKGKTKADAVTVADVPAGSANIGTESGVKLTGDDARKKGVELMNALGGPEHEKAALVKVKEELKNLGVKKYDELSPGAVAKFCAAMDTHIEEASEAP